MEWLTLQGLTLQLILSQLRRILDDASLTYSGRINSRSICWFISEYYNFKIKVRKKCDFHHLKAKAWKKKPKKTREKRQRNLTTYDLRVFAWCILELLTLHFRFHFRHSWNLTSPPIGKPIILVSLMRLCRSLFMYATCMIVNFVKLQVAVSVSWNSTERNRHDSFHWSYGNLVPRVLSLPRESTFSRLREDRGNEVVVSPVWRHADSKMRPGDESSINSLWNLSP